MDRVDERELGRGWRAGRVAAARWRGVPLQLGGGEEGFGIVPARLAAVRRRGGVVGAEQAPAHEAVGRIVRRRRMRRAELDVGRCDVRLSDGLGGLDGVRRRQLELRHQRGEQAQREPSPLPGSPMLGHRHG
jgi:hypothetical protein